MKQKRIPVAPKIQPRQRVPSWQRQKKIQRWILIAGIAVIAVIVGIVSFGFYSTQLRPSLQPAAKVDGKTFDMGYLMDMIDYTGLGSNPTIARGMTDRLVELIWDNEVLLKGGKEFGVSVTDEEVSRLLKDRNLSGSRAARNMARAELLSGKIFEQQFKPKAPASAPQIRAQAMLLASRDKAQEAGKRLDAGELFADIAKSLTEVTQLKENGGEVDWVPQGVITEVFDQVAFGLKPGEMSQLVLDEKAVKPGGYWIIRVTEKDEVGVRVERILLGSKEKAQKVKEQIEAGAGFAALARELSQDFDTKDKGGDPGKKASSTLSPKLAEAALGLELNKVSEPIFDDSVSTEGAYWIIKLVEGPVEKEVSDQNKDLVARNLFIKWFMSMREKSKLENLLDDAKKDWVVAKLSSR
ncbi:MAG: peptidylprolyl isomerase [Dehalococcoidia bacterium]|nr:peptidylprolyl isomerase [Dehalococcoidia bacterium]